MTGGARTLENNDPLSGDLSAIRLDQARLLLQRTRSSCLIVGAVILYFTALILFSEDYAFAAAWFAAASALVGVVYIYPHVVIPNGLTAGNFRRYLTGHTVISGVTGLVWSGFAIAYIDTDSVLHLFIAINIVCSISLGGMLPSAEYRPTFVALATGMFVPFSAYWLVMIDGPLRLIGLGTLILYGFGLLVSARAEVQTLTTLAAERNRVLGEKLREKSRQIEKASADKSRFLAATSHDMSQPLQAQGFFLRALRATLDRSDQLELLDRVEAAWRSQQSLLQSLVETARLDSGAIIVKSRPVPLGPVIAVLKTEFAQSARARSIDLRLPEAGPVVRTDPLLLTRILRNLLSNALKFTPEGGRVEMTYRGYGHSVMIEISDSGPGIPAEAHERVFDEYVQLGAPDSDGQHGLGLGLNIVRQLALRLDITLELDSAAGQGTTFRLTLDAAAPQDTPEEEPATLDELDGAPLIVLVDDETAVRDGLSVLLTMWGCSVIAAASGREAIRLLAWSDRTPALLIADKRLADGEDGLETIADLRSELADEVPAILLTGDIHSFERAGGTSDLTVLSKPADAEALHGALVEALRARAQS